MGCPICIDAFGVEEEKGKRPVALPCGHIFHKECSDSWLKTCRIKGEKACCPMCKQDVGAARALPLWPSDVNDLDFYLQHKHYRQQLQMNPPKSSRAIPATVHLDQKFTREEQADLLGNLMDFRQHIQGYVMAANDVRMSTEGGHERIFRLFSSMLSESDRCKKAKTEFEGALDSLTTAAKLFSEKLISLKSIEIELEEHYARSKAEGERIAQARQSLHKHMMVKEAEERRMNEEAARMKRREHLLSKELAEVERHKESIEKQREAMQDEVREANRQMMKAKLESHTTIAQREGDVQVQLNKMKAYVEEQERLRIEADDEAKKANKKSNFLADRVKLLGGKLHYTKAELDSMKKKAGTSGPSYESQSKGKAKVRGDETPNEEGEQVADKSIGEDGYVELDARGPSMAPGETLPAKRQRTGSLSPAPLSSSFMHNLPDYSSRYEKRPLVIDLEEDLDQEMNDDGFPMPGALRRSYIGASKRAGSSKGQSVSTPSGLMLPIGLGEETAPRPSTRFSRELSTVKDPYERNNAPAISSEDDTRYFENEMDPFIPSGSNTNTGDSGPSQSTRSKRLRHNKTGARANGSSNNGDLTTRALAGTVSLGPRHRNH